MFQLTRYIDVRPWLLPLLLLLWASLEGAWCSRGEIPQYRNCAGISDVKSHRHHPPRDEYLQPLPSSYTLSLEMTLLSKNITHQVKEIYGGETHQDTHGMTGNKNIVTIRHTDTTSTMYYYYSHKKRVVLEEQDGNCMEYKLRDIPLDYWGWLIEKTNPKNEDLMFGPSGLLRRFPFEDKLYLVGVKNIDGVRCEEWLSCVGIDVEIRYFFPKSRDKTTENHILNEGKGVLPVQYDVIFMDTGERFQYKITGFLPHVDHHALNQALQGSACEKLENNLASLPLPRIPMYFSYSQEMIESSPMDASAVHGRVSHKLQVSHNKLLGLSRFDLVLANAQDSPYSIASQVKVIRDYNTGIEYIINKESGKCSKSRISESVFSSRFDGMVTTDGSQLESSSLFHLDDSFSFVGMRTNRGIRCALWSSVRSDIPDPSTGGLHNFPKAVLNYCFMKSQPRSLGGAEVDIPLNSDLIIYNSSNAQQVLKRLTSNFYDFNLHWESSEDKFKIDECLEDGLEDWSYLVLAFPTDDSMIKAAMLKNKRLLRHQLLVKLMKQGQISPTRISSIDISKGESSSVSGINNSGVIIATIKILPRSPYIFSFSLAKEEEPAVNPGLKEKNVDNIHTVEECAQLCLMQEEFLCRSFYHCVQRTCTLWESEGSTLGAPLNKDSNCTHWISTGNNGVFQDLPSSQAYEAILQSIRTAQFTIDLPFQGKEVSLAASEALHYKFNDLQNPLQSRFPMMLSRTSLVDPDIILNKVSTLEECLTRCLKGPFYKCQTVAYSKEENQCMLASLIFELHDSALLQPHSDATVYSRSHLDDFQVIFGGISLSNTISVVSKVDSVDTCARHCSEDGLRCLSFEWCHDKRECHLHDHNLLDVTARTAQGTLPGERRGYHTGTSCIHFSRGVDDTTFTNYHHQGTAMGYHKTLAAQNTGVASCAQICLNWKGGVCESFDFCQSCGEANQEVCGEANLGQQNLCFISSRQRGDGPPRIMRTRRCQHYSRKNFEDAYYSEGYILNESDSEHQFTDGDMVGVACITVILGALLVAGFLVTLVMTADTKNQVETSLNKPMTYVTLRSAQGESES